MSSILGLGNRGINLSQLRNQEEKKSEKMEKSKQKIENFDTYTPSTMAMSEPTSESEDETLFDYMGEDNDVAAVNIPVEDAEMDVEDAEMDVEDAEMDVEDLDLDLENNMSAIAPVRVNGYVSSLSDDDRAMLAAAYQGFQALKLEGTSLFDYMGDTSGWFESAASAPSSYDTSGWDLSSFEDFLASLGTNSEETDEVDDSVESTEEVETEEATEIVEE